MKTYEEALKELLGRVPQPRSIRVPLEAAFGRVLAAPIEADMDLPPFRKSFVDGYALRGQDTQAAPVTLEVIGVVAAGSGEGPTVMAGQAVQIMTGAPVPSGADAVQMVEQTRSLGPASVECLEPVSAGTNLAPRGNEVKQGDQVLAPGRVVGPAELGVLATFGFDQVEVFAAPSVAILPTGDEIVEVAAQPAFGQIRNSNAYTLRAQCRSLGLEATLYPVTPDDPEATRRAIAEGMKQELVIFTGGVSMGEYDYVHKVLAQEGVEILFHKASIKPGKPVLVGRKGNRMIFGLPGNPVSAFVTFELFVRPAVRCWQGFRSVEPPRVAGRLVRPVRQKPGRTYFKPARTFREEGGFRVEPIETKGSADLVAFSPANSLLIMGAERARMAEGEEVEVILLNHFCEDAFG